MFLQKLRAAVRANSSFLCIGLDPDPERLPPSLSGDMGTRIVSFLMEIIDATSDLVCAYKPNLAFFEVLGPEGASALAQVRRGVPEVIPVIADAKRGDIGHSAGFYARALFQTYEFDAATVSPYGGRDSVEAFAQYANHGVFVWCRGSNPGAADLQDLALADGRRVYEAVAASARDWNIHGNLGLVVGATAPTEVRNVRRICPDMPLLLPGVGFQEGDLEGSVAAAVDAAGGGFLVNVSRAVLYASNGEDFAAAARRTAADLRQRINRAREAATAAGL